VRFRLIVTAILVVLVMIFAIQNAAIVEIKLLFWQVAFPRSLLIFLVLMIGMVLGWILKAMVRISRRFD